MEKTILVLYNWCLFSKRLKQKERVNSKFYIGTDNVIHSPINPKILSKSVVNCSRKTQLIYTLYQEDHEKAADYVHIIHVTVKKLCSNEITITYPIFGLSKSIANFLLSGLIVLECPPYKYLRWPMRKWGKFPPWVVTNTSLWRQTV